MSGDAENLQFNRECIRRSGLPNDVIVGHILPSTFAPPWAETEEDRLEERQRRFREAMGWGNPGGL